LIGILISGFGSGSGIHRGENRQKLGGGIAAKSGSGWFCSPRVDGAETWHGPTIFLFFGAKLQLPHMHIRKNKKFYYVSGRMSSPLIVVGERLRILVIPESLAVAIRDVEELGLAGGRCLGQWIGAGNLAGLGRAVTSRRSSASRGNRNHQIRTTASAVKKHRQFGWGLLSRL